MQILMKKRNKRTSTKDAFEVARCDIPATLTYFSVVCVAYFSGAA